MRARGGVVGGEREREREKGTHARRTTHTHTQPPSPPPKDCFEWDDSNAGVLLQLLSVAGARTCNELNGALRARCGGLTVDCEAD